MAQFIIAPCLLCYYHVWLADQDRALERWLLDTAAGHVEPDIIEVVRKELG